MSPGNAFPWAGSNQAYEYAPPISPHGPLLEPHMQGAVSRDAGRGIETLQSTVPAIEALRRPDRPRLFGAGVKSLLDDADEEGPRFFTQGRIAIPAQEVTLFFGDGKVGKSAHLQYLSVCVAGAKRFHGQEVLQGPVIYIDAENAWSMTRDRILALARAIGADIETVDENLVLRSIRGQVLGDHEKDLLEEVSGLKPVLVVVDGLVSAFGMNPVNGDEVTEAFRVLNSLCELGTTVGLIHHVSSGGKGNASPGQPPPPAGNRYIQHFVRASYYVDRTYIQAMPNNYDIPELRVPHTFKALEVGGLPQLGRAKSPSAKRRQPMVKPDDRNPGGIVSYIRSQGGKVSQADLKRHLAKVWGVKPGQVGRDLIEMRPRLEAAGVVFEGPSNAPRLRLVSV